MLQKMNIICEYIGLCVGYKCVMDRFVGTVPAQWYNDDDPSVDVVAIWLQTVSQ